MRGQGGFGPTPWGARVPESTRSGIGRDRWRHATALALLAVLLMPITYRAGATVPHAHALLQLIHEAAAGVPAHHRELEEGDTHHPEGDAAASQSGAPPLQVVAVSALLPLVLIGLILQPPRGLPGRSSDRKRTGRAQRPGHPPPRRLAAARSIP